MKTKKILGKNGMTDVIVLIAVIKRSYCVYWLYFQNLYLHTLPMSQTPRPKRPLSIITPRAPPSDYTRDF